MRLRITLLVLLVVLAACGGGTPDVEDWLVEAWDPLVTMVPEPGQESAEICDRVLGELRERGSSVRPAPLPEIGDTADSWVRAAESLMFDCAADLEELDYEERHLHLTRLEAEVEALTGP
jgi:hypothetical protein